MALRSILGEFVRLSESRPTVRSLIAVGIIMSVVFAYTQSSATLKSYSKDDPLPESGRLGLVRSLNPVRRMFDLGVPLDGARLGGQARGRPPASSGQASATPQRQSAADVAARISDAEMRQVDEEVQKS